MKQQTLPDIFHILSHYHRWTYEILFSAVDQLKEKDYFLNMGLFFKSIHGTLNHLYLCDHLWYCRFTDTPHSFVSVNDISFPNYDGVKHNLRQQAKQWCQFINEQPKALPDTITSISFKGNMTVSPYLPTLLHVFNHATHHRGQISTALTQKNIAATEMDLYYYLKTLPK